jgi:homoserine O-succinyltransferase/O-acetyltransferase
MIESNVPIKIAVLDLYNGVANQGMRCIRDLLRDANGRYGGVNIEFVEFDVRAADEIPDLSFDIFISSGGPGSPFDGEGTRWEKNYFNWLDAVLANNQANDIPRKYLLAICHSFQMMCRHFQLARVVKRKSDSFGIMPVHKTSDGKHDALFSLLADPFYAADFREWQVLQPKTSYLREIGASVLALEKIRPHVPLERAVMAMRLSDEIVGTQFHPEADPKGMFFHFAKDAARGTIVDKHGPDKFRQIIQRLMDPGALLPTYRAFIPGFIENAVRELRPEAFDAEV